MRHDRPRYRPGDAFVFGPETRGLPDAVLDACLPERRLRLPMQPGARSLNLSNAVAVLAYEAWRAAGLHQSVSALTCRRISAVTASRGARP